MSELDNFCASNVGCGQEEIVMACEDISIQLAQQYFRDLEQDNREDTESNLTAWLWFTCPAHMRTEVRAEIERLRRGET